MEYHLDGQHVCTLIFLTKPVTEDMIDEYKPRRVHIADVEVTDEHNKVVKLIRAEVPKSFKVIRAHYKSGMVFLLCNWSMCRCEKHHTFVFEHSKGYVPRLFEIRA